MCGSGCRRGSARFGGGAGGCRARCGLPVGGELRERHPADALPLQEDVEAAPEETRGERAGAGRRERPGTRAGGGRPPPPRPAEPCLLNTDPPPAPPSALYREYRTLKEALGQAGGLGPHGSEQSVPAAAAEEVPGLDIPACRSTFCMLDPGGVVTQALWGEELRGRADRVEEGQPPPPGLRGWRHLCPPATPAFPRPRSLPSLPADAGAQLLGAPPESGCDPEPPSSIQAQLSGICAGLREEA